MLFFQVFCEDEGDAEDFLRSLWVCRAWRETIAGTHSFWSVIPFDIQNDLRDRWIEASGDLPLKLRFRLVSQLPFLRIASCAPRVHHLEVEICDPYALSLLRCIAFPALRGIDMRPHSCHSSPLEVSWVDYVFRETSNWYSIVLKDVCCKALPLGSISNLRTLSIEADRSSWDDISAISLRNFTDAATMMPQITDITLAVPVTLDIDVLNQDKPIVTLPSLVSVTFRGYAQDTIALLTCLDMPNLRFLDLTTYAPKHRQPGLEQEAPYEYGSSLCALLRELVRSMGVTVSDVEIQTGSRYEASMQFYGGSAESSFQLNFLCPRRDVISVLAGSLNCFRLRDLTNLTFKCTPSKVGDYGRYNQEDTNEQRGKGSNQEERDPWSIIFEAIPNVKCLVLSGSADVWRALPIVLRRERMPWSGLNIFFVRGIMAPPVVDEWLFCLETASREGRSIASLTVINYEIGEGMRERFGRFVGRLEWINVGKLRTSTRQ